MKSFGSSVLVLCSVVLCSVTFSHINVVYACKPPPPTRVTVLNLEPDLDSVENCLSVVSLWESGGWGQYYGVDVKSRCDAQVEIVVKGCDEKCSPILIENGVLTKIDRSEIDHPTDEQGRLILLWSDGNLGGQITLTTTIVKPERPFCREQENGCTMVSSTKGRPLGLFGLIVLLSFVGIRRKVIVN